mmetsp:Transcript_73169/g.145529  ORF Transcript_73169/g.145529 Transcript_73169/m.145529 type:complete len:81 (-) Transcript_73169:180-422(-)
MLQMLLLGLKGRLERDGASSIVHVIEPAWEVVEQNTKRLVGMHCLPAHNNSHCRTHPTSPSVLLLPWSVVRAYNKQHGHS